MVRHVTDLHVHTTKSIPEEGCRLNPIRKYCPDSLLAYYSTCYIVIHCIDKRNNGTSGSPAGSCATVITGVRGLNKLYIHG